MKVMFSAGEASGDTHAASVAGALKTLYPEVTMLGMGGSRMAAAGVILCTILNSSATSASWKLLRHCLLFSN